MVFRRFNSQRSEFYFPDISFLIPSLLISLHYKSCDFENVNLPLNLERLKNLKNLDIATTLSINDSKHIGDERYKRRKSLSGISIRILLSGEKEKSSFCITIYYFLKEKISYSI